MPESWKTVADPMPVRNRIFESWVRHWPAEFMRQSGIGSTGLSETVAWMRIILPASDSTGPLPRAVAPEQTRQAFDAAFGTLSAWFASDIPTPDGPPGAGASTGER